MLERFTTSYLPLLAVSNQDTKSSKSYGYRANTLNNQILTLKYLTAMMTLQNIKISTHPKLIQQRIYRMDV